MINRCETLGLIPYSYDFLSYARGVLLLSRYRHATQSTEICRALRRTTGGRNCIHATIRQKRPSRGPPRINFPKARPHASSNVRVPSILTGKGELRESRQVDTFCSIANLRRLRAVNPTRLHSSLLSRSRRCPCHRPCPGRAGEGSAASPTNNR